MIARAASVLRWLGAVSALAACEPSLMSDPNSAQSQGSSGGATNAGSGGVGQSPRWAGNNPAATPPNAGAPQPAGPAAGNPPAGGNTAAGPSPWGGAAQQPNAGPAPGTAVVTQGGAVAPAGNGAVQPSGAAVCDDNRPRALELPGESCARPCRGGWQRCFDACGQDRACVAACDDTFRECMRGCY